MFLTEWNSVVERHPDKTKARFMYNGKVLTPVAHECTKESDELVIYLNEKAPSTTWDGNHPRQAEWEALWDKHVPDSGEADTPYGEAIRGLGRLQHEYYNNGFCNALEDGHITRFYQSFIDGIHRLGYNMSDFERWMRTQEYGSCDFDADAARRFNAITEYLLDHD